MKVAITSSDYVDYLLAAGKVIAAEKDYITALDSKTGDGDHWVNLNMGFEKIASMQEELKGLEFAPMLKKVGMTMMSAVGGSSGVLYGSAYIAAAKAMQEHTVMDEVLMLSVLEAMQQAIMERGQAQPGFKTMLDSLHTAAAHMRQAMAAGQSAEQIMQAMKNGAEEGMLATKDMPAVKGRASYQANKGVGELDPGAVTMCMQLETLAGCATKTIH